MSDPHEPSDDTERPATAPGAAHASRHAGLAAHGGDMPGSAHVPAHLPPRDATLRRARWVALTVLLLLAVGAGLNVASRYSQARALEGQAADQSRIYVSTVRPRPGGASRELTLPGSLQGASEAPIYARSAGYVRRWTRDIGAVVKQGEVLAEIATPEVDQQLSQALANRAQLVASLELARTSSVRTEALRAQGAVSQQEFEDRRSAYQQAQANLAAADANAARLRELQGFKRVVAPFSGTVTQRNVNVGDLIDASGSLADKRPLFTLTQVDALRLYVYVPQSEAVRIKPGQKVKVMQPELPGQSFTGEIVRTAGAIGAATRTLQVEIRLPNSDGRLLPGAYVQVSLTREGAATALAVPVNTLMFRPEGTRVAVVDGESRVRLRPVTPGVDQGSMIEITSGIGPGDVLVLNPPDSLNEGDAVSVVAPASASPASAAAASAPPAKAGA